MDKRQSRLRRAGATRKKIRELREHRLAVHSSNLHIYANIISPEGDRVLVSASTIEPEVRQEVTKGSNIEAAAFIGKRMVEMARAVGIDRVAVGRKSDGV